MTYTIVGLGESSQNWTPNGYSIGVNDAWKFGQPTDALLVCNRPSEFSLDRQKIITSSKPKDFYSNKANWSPWFPDWKRVRLHPWNGSLHDWHRSDGPSAYSFNTSPIIAITLAYNLGAKEIILWGVDFKTHHIFNDKNPQTRKEIEVYLQVFAALKEKGVSVYRGSDGTAFDAQVQRYANETTYI